MLCIKLGIRCNCSKFFLIKDPQAHPEFDEIEREKVCSVIDPLKLSYEARFHASQNKRLPLQKVPHPVYYDQLEQRGKRDDCNTPDAVTATARNYQLQAGESLVRENEMSPTELMKMKLYISDFQKGNQGGGSGNKGSSRSKKATFFSSMAMTLGKLNPFRYGSKDTSQIDERTFAVDINKPQRRRFSIS